ncbi:MAG: hypothetical protein H6R27_117 [Proteobacteria bacterium]|nr:hypothetical protein [Pseudomonadota bacterium]
METGNMNRRRFLQLLSASGLSACAAPAAGPVTQVMVIASMHSVHQNSVTFTYDDLYERIRAFNPTAVGVEIREEDLIPPAPYLATSYPREMVELARRYAPIVHGIDWLGPAIEGRPIPSGYFERLDVKRLERELDADAEFSDPELDALQRQKSGLLTGATAASLNDGRYDTLNRTYYRRLAERLRGTRYQLVSDFYSARDRHIADNVINLINANPGGRVAIVVGADHRSAVIDAIKATFRHRVRLVPV